MERDVQIRRARADDKEAVLAFCAHIWGGQDYLPQAWDNWLNDSQGILLVALQKGVPVGVVRAAFPGRGEAWLEGMRVDPERRGAGIATALFAALVEEVRQRGAHVARLMTLGTNYPVHRMCAHLGLARVLRLRPRSRPLEVGATPPAARPLGADEIALAQALLARQGLTGGVASFLAVTGGLCPTGGGVWTSWSEDRLGEHLARGEVWTWQGIRGPLAIAVVSPHRRRPGVWEVGLLEGPVPDCTALLAALVRRPALPASEPDTPAQVRLALPLELPRLDRAAAAASYRPRRGWQYWIFERALL
jgi:GNAT superfamily N-acetyltransferase